MSAGLDTSFVLRLLVGEPADQADAALAELAELKAKGVRPLVSDLVVAETYFALQHHYGVPKSKALAAIRGLLGSGDVTCLGVSAQVLETPSLATVKPGFVDRMICRQYDQHAAEILTFQRAAGRLPLVRVIG